MLGPGVITIDTIIRILRNLMASKPESNFSSDLLEQVNITVSSIFSSL